jgi:hypothetical protein
MANGSVSKYGWSDVSNVHRRKNCAYVYMKDGHAFILPSACCAGKEAELHALLRGHGA